MEINTPPNTSTDDYEQRRIMRHNRRLELLPTLQSSYEQYDKAILSLSSGGLGVSILLLKDLIPIEFIIYLPLLVFSWGMFALSIVSTVASFIFAQWSIHLQFQAAEEYYINGNMQAYDKEDKYAKATKVANYLSGGSFLFAIMATIVFSSINIIHYQEINIMSEKDQSNSTQRFLGGVVPPKMEKGNIPGNTRGIIVPPMPKLPPTNSGSTGGDSSKKNK